MSFLKSFNYRKEACGYAKVIQRKSIEKNGQVSEILKTMGTQIPARKKEKERDK